MKSTAGWRYPNIGATNECGFTGLPGGYRDFFFLTDGNYTYLDVGGQGLWWSSTENDSNNAWYRSLYDYDSVADRDYFNKRLGVSVRCVRD